VTTKARQAALALAAAAFIISMFGAGGSAWANGPGWCYFHPYACRAKPNSVAKSGTATGSNISKSAPKAK
jgi:hypothetical protein